MNIRLTVLVAALVTASAAAGHDWYSGKLDPQTGRTCCGGHDCRPLDESEITALSDGGYLATSRRWRIPPGRVQLSPDGRYHICESIAVGDPGWADKNWLHRNFYYDWTCFFAPDGAVSGVHHDDDLHHLDTSRLAVVADGQ